MLMSAADDTDAGNIDNKLVTQQTQCTDSNQNTAATTGIVPSRPDVKKPADAQVRRHSNQNTAATTGIVP